MIVAVNHVNPGLSEVCQAEQQALLDLVELPRLNDVLPHLLLPGEGEQLVLDAKLWRQKGIDKGNIVVNPSHLEDFLPSQAELLIPPAPFVQIVTVIIFLAELAGIP